MSETIEQTATAVTAQPAPSFADAYQGAMEEVAIWKKRALEAEDLNRKFIAEINGPMLLGEPVAQPAPSMPEGWLRAVDEALVVTQRRKSDEELMQQALDDVLTLRTKNEELRAEIEAIHSLLDGDESKIIRNAKDGYPEGREPKELTLTERVTALCKYAADWKRWFSETESKIAEMERQETARRVTPTAYRWRYRGAIKWQYGELTEEAARLAEEHNHEVQPLYALPGAKGE